MSISDRLIELIKGKGITPYVLSSETGVSEAVLSRLINKTTINPSSKNLTILANYFNVNIDWLRTGTGEKFIKQSNSEPTELQKVLSIIESQQRTIENLSETINRLIAK